MYGFSDDDGANHRRGRLRRGRIVAGALAVAVTNPARAHAIGGVTFSALRQSKTQPGSGCSDGFQGAPQALTHAMAAALPTVSNFSTGGTAPARDGKSFCAALGSKLVDGGWACDWCGKKLNCEWAVRQHVGSDRHRRQESWREGLQSRHDSLCHPKGGSAAAQPPQQPPHAIASGLASPTQEADYIGRSLSARGLRSVAAPATHPASRFAEFQGLLRKKRMAPSSSPSSLVNFRVKSRKLSSRSF